MTSFCVYGVTRELFRANAEKDAKAAMDKMIKLADANKQQRPSKSEALAFFAAERDRIMDELYTSDDKPKKISDWFSSPDRCREFMATFGSKARLMSIQVRVKEQVDGKLKSVVKPYNG